MLEPAARVAERPDHHLEYAVGQSESHHRQGRRADLTPSSPAICGSSGSHTRRFAALANEASASRAMARVGVSLACALACPSTSRAIGNGYEWGRDLSRAQAAVHASHV